MINHLGHTKSGLSLVMIIAMVIILLLITYIDLFISPFSSSFWHIFYPVLHSSLIICLISFVGVHYISFDSIGNKEREIRIRGYLEELEDYRPWHAEEATWKIRSLIRKLNLEGLTSFDLHSACLKGVDLEALHLEGSNITDGHLEGAILFNTNFERVDFFSANLEGALMNSANLKDAYLHGANLKGADLRELKVEGADFTEANLEGSNLTTADFKLFQLKESYLSNETIMMDGTQYDESWAKLIADAEPTIKKEHPQRIVYFSRQ